MIFPVIFDFPSDFLIFFLIFFESVRDFFEYFTPRFRIPLCGFNIEVFPKITTSLLESRDLGP